MDTSILSLEHIGIEVAADFNRIPWLDSIVFPSGTH